jgi:membrane associated rhomboid family serine protease
MDIDYVLQRTWWGWCLIVDEIVENEARLQLALYEQEQRAPTSLADAPSPPGGIELGVLAFFSVLLSMFYLQGRYGFGVDWTSAGRVDVAAILNGEVWRTITALTLHRNFWHLLGNLAFGTIFGVMLSRQLGTGLAWLAIVAAGACGNGMNALVQRSEHLSVGASTAVFSALGLLSACSFFGGRLHRDTWARRWAPIVGGFWVLTWLGTGDAQTDIVAHLTGFAAGLLLGAALSRAPRLGKNSPAVQWAAGFIVIGAIGVSWAWAI